MEDTNYAQHTNGLRFFFSRLEKNQLPGYHAHVELTPYRKLPGVQETANARQGAVAVIITLVNDIPHIVLTKRADYEGVHGGQISFPGGKKDETDPDLLFTSKRETLEEIGLNLLDEDLLTELTGIYIPPSNFMVTPFAYLIERDEQLVVNREVNYIINLPLFDLADKMQLSKTDIKLFNGMTIKKAPCFMYNNEIIWGATAAILNEVRLLVKELVKS